jgi:hypothetical protein
MQAIKYHRQISEERCRLLKADDVVNLLILPPPSPLSFAVATATATFVCIIAGGHGRMLLLKRALVQKATLRVGCIWQIYSFRLK